MLRKRLLSCWAWRMVISLVLAGPGASVAPAFGDDPPPPPSAGGPKGAAGEVPAAVEPKVLNRPLEAPAPEAAAAPTIAPEALTPYRTQMDPPSGYTGPSGILPRENQETAHFVPIEDRWRLGFPAWDRYDKGHPNINDYPYVIGNILNPYKQNVLKGDFSILGQNTFLTITAESVSLFEFRQVPTATTPFESTQNPFQENFFGNPNQYFFNQNIVLSVDLTHGDAGYKQPDWRIHLTPIFNVNLLDVNELGIINPDVRRGTNRTRTFFTLEEWFAEAKLSDLSPDFDILSLRVGSQEFNSDFRGFIFSDTNRAIRLFGNRLSNRDQFNLIYFDQMEKDTNSGLNNLGHDRNQSVLIANYYRQDFIFPGYTTELSVHYDNDRRSFKFDENNFLVRPAPVGVFKPHTIDVAYLGWTGDGHLGRYNITHAYYWAVGYDTLNPLANQAQDINAHMAAVELSYDRDWARFRTSFFYATGDSNISNKHATGFDSIFDNPNFAGGEFSYWQRQQIGLFGVNLVNRNSLIPDLRSSKIQGQVNFVNPGLVLVNGGVDFDITPKLKMINNVNFLWFDETDPLRQFVFQNKIRHFIGTDLSAGFEYRPFLNNNVQITFGVSALIPGKGFKDLYNSLTDNVDTLFASFLELTLLY
jgi:hypothetical protein